MALEPLASHPTERHDHDGCTPRAPQREAQSGIDELINKARKALDGKEDQAEDALDKAADAIKSHTDDDMDAKVDQVVDKALSLIHI